MRHRVFVDTCLWYPPTLRAFLLAAHVVGMVELTTSESVLDELFANLVEKAGMTEQHAEAVAQAIESVLCEGGVRRVVPDSTGSPVAFSGPDPDDGHVVAGALGANADFILTRNLKHFPPASLEPFDLDAVDPDDFFAPIVKRVGMPEAMQLVDVALQFPPAGVTACVDLGHKLCGCGLEHVGGILTSASWQRAFAMPRAAG